MMPWFGVVSLATGVVGVLVGTLSWPIDRARRMVLWVNHWMWGRILFALGPLWSVRRQIPALGPGPYVVVSNHASFIDIPLVLGLPLPIRVCARRGLFRVPLMGWYMRYSRQICVDADDRQSAEVLLAACRQALAAGVSILVFPEGTRTDDGEIGAFGKAAFRLARDLEVPLLPVVLAGSREAYPKGSMGLVRPFCRFEMHVLPPVRATGPLRELARGIRGAMTTELASMRAGG